MYKINFLLLIILSTAFSVFAQSDSIKGQIVDEQGNPVPGANIYLEGTVIGIASDEEGFFNIRSIPPEQFVLVISVIGFQEKKVLIGSSSGQAVDLGTIILQTSPLPLQPIVTTASKYRQNVQDVAASMANVTVHDIESRNSTTIDDALKYISGINLNQDQINIRGSSGYSRGVGSRVLMLVDGVPYITGDTQGLVFEALNMSEIDNIEIVKGPGSALYGSSAIGGVINVLTKPISEQGEIVLKMYGGMHDDPYYNEWKWSGRSRYLNGINAGYSKKIDDFGFRIGVSRDEDDSYRQNDWKKRVNIAGKVQYDFSAFQRLTLSGNYMEQKRGNFLYWQNLNNALKIPESQVGDNVLSHRFYINSEYRHLMTGNQFFKINVMWFNNKFDDQVGGEKHNSTSDFFNGELQYNVSSGDHFLTFGLNPAYSTVSSNLFASHEALGAAVFAQDEIKWTEKLFTTIGARFDYSDIDDLGTDQQLSPKIGLVWRGIEDGAIRLSAGTGFRAPSIAEAFTSTSAGGVIVIPNTSLKTEQSSSVEIGWNQVINENLAFDMAFFYNNYRDLIEAKLLDSLKAQFQNITEARIAGAEFNVYGQILSKKLSYKLGYTYTDPRDTKRDIYLSYRPRHLLYASLSTQIGIASAGLDYRFISRYDEIDDTFSLIITDAEKRVDAHIVDARVSVNFDLGTVPVTTALQINNVLQYNYVDLVGSIAPIRQFVLSLETRL